MRAVMRAGYVIRRRLLALTRWPTRGVKAMAFDPQGRLLLVRHGYGRSDLWMLPGGGVGWRERPDAAVRRELMEETGCRIKRLELVGTFSSVSEGKRDTIFLYRGRASNEPLPDGLEVIEARFFALDALPPTTSPATMRRVPDLADGAEGGTWYTPLKPDPLYPKLSRPCAAAKRLSAELQQCRLSHDILRTLWRIHQPSRAYPTSPRAWRRSNRHILALQ
jgi:ADP-ribose pyrophosphatase YjhB (NUDIX family)